MVCRSCGEVVWEVVLIVGLHVHSPYPVLSGKHPRKVVNYLVLPKLMVHSGFLSFVLSTYLSQAIFQGMTLFSLSPYALSIGWPILHLTDMSLSNQTFVCNFEQGKKFKLTLMKSMLSGVC